MSLPQVINELHYWLIVELRRRTFYLLEQIDGHLRAKDVTYLTAHRFDDDCVLRIAGVLINHFIHQVLSDYLLFVDYHAVAQYFAVYDMVCFLFHLEICVLEEVLKHFLDRLIEVLDGIEKYILAKLDITRANLLKNALYT